ncbi:hypothetical protein GCM10027592_29040 [Spirosoma flavus]
MKDDFEPDRKGFESKEIKLVSDKGNNTMIVLSKSNMGLFFAMAVSTICVDKGTELKFLFEDKSIESAQQTNKYNCNGMSVFWLEPEYMNTIKNKLKSQKLSGLRLMAESGYQTYKFTQSESDLLYNIYNCIIQK